MQKYHVKIKGICPVLHHGVQNLGMGTDKSSKKKGGSALLGNPEEWRETIYFMPSLGVYMPAINVEASILEASKQFKVGRGSASKYAKAGYMIESPTLPFLVEGKEIKTIEAFESLAEKKPLIASVYKCTVKNPATKGRNMRYRAMFNNWESEFELINRSDDYLSLELTKEIIEYAGNFVGVCDYRPRFGRFELVSIKQI